MKIDKVIFTSSPDYIDFWNINSKIYKEYLGIEPICFLFGEPPKDKNISEKYGKVKRVNFIDNLHKMLQLTWYKFYHTTTEPETTWMIGDMDMIPLQKNWFVNNIADIPEDYYIHLNYTGIAQMMNKSYDCWEQKGGNLTDGVDLPAHYHVAKGKTFKKALNIENSFEENVKKIIAANRYGLGINFWGNSKGEDMYYWCAEENYSSEMLFNSLQKGIVKFKGFHYHNKLDRIDRNDYTANGYGFDPIKLKNNQYVDIHCFKHYAQQENYLLEILKEFR
jgi:hypothetical protein